MRSLLSTVVTAALALSACALPPAAEETAGSPEVAKQAQALSPEDVSSWDPTETSFPRPDLPFAGAPSAPQCTPKGERCITRGNNPNNPCCDGTVCFPTACTQSFPPNCFGVCRAPNPPKPQPKSCLTSDQCVDGEVCSTTLGDCQRPPCAPGRVCPAVCAGVCVAAPK